MLPGPPLTGHSTSAAKAQTPKRMRTDFTPMNYNRATPGMPFWVPLILAAKSFAVDGIVVALDPAARTMLVSHRPIGKYMPAMMMPFRVEQPGDLEGLYPGARVQFDLVVGKDRSVARHVRKTGDGEIPPAKEKLRVGDPLPEFALT